MPENGNVAHLKGMVRRKTQWRKRNKYNVNILNLQKYTEGLKAGEDSWESLGLQGDPASQS